MAEIEQIIAAINPDKYYGGSAKELADFKKMIRKEGFDKAAEKAKPKAVQEFKLIYNSSSETLEPVYFWILDFMQGGVVKQVDKLVDNFAATPGSGHFAELGQRATVMQQQAMKILGDVNTVIKSIQNLIYDLKDFELRLKMYDDAESSDKNLKEAGMLGLKQIWMDKVDVQKGRGSINMMAQDLNFITLRDAFLIATTLDDVKGMDLNDRVKRVLSARLGEFLDWRERSEVELRKRYEIEKAYLKSQISAVKMYSRWARPYLLAAEKLMMTEYSARKPELVNAFETVYFQLVLFGKNSVDPRSSALAKELPPEFVNLKLKREYYSCVIVSLTFRGIPQKLGQQYAFGGKVDVGFKAYALNQEELDVLYYQLDKSDFTDALKLVSGVTDESLGQLEYDIEEILGKSKEEKKKAKEAEANINPFSALFGFGGKKEKTEEKTSEAERDKKDKENKKKMEKLKTEGIKKDSYSEKLVRNLAALNARKTCFAIYDIYKKAHGMPSVPFDASFQKEDTKVSFGDLFKV
jgi:hypothetical protein